MLKKAHTQKKMKKKHKTYSNVTLKIVIFISSQQFYLSFSCVITHYIILHVYNVTMVTGKPMIDRTYTRSQLQGFLEIRKGGVLQNWVRRLCVVSGTRLLIYKGMKLTFHNVIMSMRLLLLLAMPSALHVYRVVKLN